MNHLTLGFVFDVVFGGFNVIYVVCVKVGEVFGLDLHWMYCTSLSQFIRLGV